jgi:hypothetical protein
MVRAIEEEGREEGAAASQEPRVCSTPLVLITPQSDVKV